MPRAIVVVPLYTNALTSDEAMSLSRSVDVLGEHGFAIVCPEDLDLAPLESILGRVRPVVERFEPGFFAGVDGYNRLMLSIDFYSRFRSYDYMLVCQTDAFVFRDDLQNWCRKGYHYIGAPWISSERNAWNKALFRLNNMFRKRKKSDEYLFKVGNGGFSLRHVQMMLRIVSEQRSDIDHELRHPGHLDHHIEDRYFSLVAPRKIPEMRIPGYREAVDFCIDRRPALALQLNGNRLPFACHGFNKRNVQRFWKPILAQALTAR